MKINFDYSICFLVGVDYFLSKVPIPLPNYVFAQGPPGACSKLAARAVCFLLARLSYFLAATGRRSRRPRCSRFSYLLRAVSSQRLAYFFCPFIIHPYSVVQLAIMVVLCFWKKVIGRVRLGGGSGSPG